MNYETHTLFSGLRVILLPQTSDVVYCGIAVKAGTRHEAAGEEGLAHFCEHLAFKGTRRRSAVQIINSLEGVGGELNAFTGKEDTVYYAATTRNHLALAVDVLCDIVFQSQYPEHEVEKEREVVCDEIESYEDSPSELIYDDFENQLFAGHPLGHNILGSSEQVRRFTGEDARRFARRYYRPDNAVFFLSGRVEMAYLLRLLTRSMEGVAATPFPAPVPSATLPPLPASLLTTRQRSTHQTHVMMGTRAFSAADSRRWPLILLNNIIGGPGLNSRLNIALRERRGLVYTVESQMVCYSDTGLWSVYFGCDPADASLCCRLVRRVLNGLMVRGLSEVQLRRAKQQLRGQLAIASDNREQFALDAAKTFLHEGRERNLDAILSHIDAVTADELYQTANLLFDPNRILTLIYQ